MSAWTPPPMAAETLTLNDCRPAIDRVLAQGAAALQSADGEALKIPAAALASADGAWRKAFDAILAIDIGRTFKAACLKLSVDHPKIEIVPDGTGSITLLPFAITSSHHPTIVMTYGAIVIPLKFDVELSIEVEGAQLHLKDGRFIGVSTGHAKGVAQISLLNSKPPVELGTPSFELPGELAFSSPVAAEAAP